MSRSADIGQESVIVLKDKLSVLSLVPYLKCDLYVIGGEQIYRTFLGEIDKWIVTEVPLAVDDADAFVAGDYLLGFKPSDSRVLGESLKVTFYERG